MKAIVTGASKGIGHAIACALAREGFDLAITARDKKNLQEIRHNLSTVFPGTEIVAHSSDVSDKASLQGFIETIRSAWGDTAPEVLVHNAGLYLPARMMEESGEALEKMMATNLFAAYYLSKAFVPAMKKNGRGHIFTICSSAATSPADGIGSYSVSKYALYGFTKNLREELKEFNIKVTAILPGSTYTHSWAGTDIPAEKFIQPQDIASAILSAFNMSGSAVADEIVINPMNKI
jgi:3-oxoacyl-[acyl-carrier protein] reductase